jgi:hypothetical protein
MSIEQLQAEIKEKYDKDMAGVREAMTNALDYVAEKNHGVYPQFNEKPFEAEVQMSEFISGYDRLGHPHFETTMRDSLSRLHMPMSKLVQMAKEIIEWKKIAAKSEQTEAGLAGPENLDYGGIKSVQTEEEEKK